MKPYMPCNGSEGTWFDSLWCDNCAHHPEDPDAPGQCEVLLRALVNEIGDEDYPREWVCDDDGGQPRCTAFMECNSEEHKAHEWQKQMARRVAAGQMTMEI